jgi:AcrR family transcriptional regulator
MRWQTDDPTPSPKRAAILDAALEIFATEGAAAATMPAIAERARVGAGTLYRYFASKEALLNAVYQGCKAELGAALLEGDLPDEPLRARVRGIWLRLWSFTRSHPHALAFLEGHHRSADLDDLSRAADAAVLLPLVELVVQGQRDEVLCAEEPAMIVAIVWGTFTGIVHAVARGHLPDGPETVLAGERRVWAAIRA